MEEFSRLSVAIVGSITVGCALSYFYFYPKIKIKWELKKSLDKLKYDMNEFTLSVENKSSIEFSNKLLIQINKDIDKIQSITLNNKEFEAFNQILAQISKDLVIFQIKLERCKNDEVLYEFKQVPSNQLSASPLEFFEIVIENNINIFINFSIILFFVFLFVVFYTLYFNNENIKVYIEVQDWLLAREKENWISPEDLSASFLKLFNVYAITCFFIYIIVFYKWQWVGKR